MTVIPTSSLTEILQRTSLLYRAGDYDAAITLLSGYCRHPQPDAHLASALCYFQQRDLAKVISHTDVVRKCHTAFAWQLSIACYLSSMAREQLGRFREAAADLRVVMDDRPAHDFDFTLQNVPPIFRVLSPPLRAPLPSAPQNYPMHQSRLNRLVILAEHERRAKNEPPPKTLERGTSGSEGTFDLLYRIQPKNISTVVRIGTEATFEVILTNELGLYRRMDMLESCVELTASIIKWNSIIEPSHIQPELAEGSSSVGPDGKAQINIIVAPGDVAATFYEQMWLLITSTDHLVLPLLCGPITVATETFEELSKEDEEIRSYRPLKRLSGRDDECVPYVLIQERADAGIPGRLWDSAFAVVSLISRLIATDRFPYRRILDLGCGAGGAGIYVAASLAGVSVLMTDLPAALPLAQTNTELNSTPIAEMGSTVAIETLEWGDLDAASEVLKNVGELDMILAADVVYETEAMDPLIATLVTMSSVETEIWIVYKRRGLDEAEEKVFWNKMEKIFNVMDANDEFCLGEIWEKVGCKLYRFKKKRL